MLTGCDLKEGRGIESLNGAEGGEAKRNKSGRKHWIGCWVAANKIYFKVGYIMSDDLYDRDKKM